MKDNVEYQIFIGCSDSQLQDEVVPERELREMVTQFFERNEIDFSMLSARGGYLHEDGRFTTEDTLIVDIIGAADLDIIRLARSLSMLMNQESSLVVRNPLKTEFC